MRDEGQATGREQRVGRDAPRVPDELERSPYDRLRPWLLAGMTALLVARPLYPSESAATQGDGLPVVMLWLVLAACWALSVVVSSFVVPALAGSRGSPPAKAGTTKERWPTFHFGWIDVAVLLVVLFHSLAALYAARHASPRPAINMLWEWIGLGLTFFLARQLIRPERETRAVVAVMLSLAVALSGYALYQHFVEMPSVRAQYAANPEGTLRDSGVWYAPDSPERQLFERRMNSPGPMGTFALTNSLAALLVPWLVIAVGIAWRTRLACGNPGDPKRQHASRVRHVAFCAAPIAVCLLLTRSRSAYVATAVGCLLLGLALRNRPRRIGWKLPVVIVLTVASLLAVTLALSGHSRDLAGRAGRSFAFRLHYWQATMPIIAAHPLVGCGPGNFQDAYTEHKLLGASEEVADPHNFLLEVWATAGTPAALALLAALAGFFGTSWRTRPACEDAGTPGPPHAGRVRHVLLGAACGYGLGLLLGQISAAPPSLVAIILGLPLAAAAMLLLHSWVHNGTLPPSLPVIGVAVLLIDLLTTGGIGLPGVAGTLWLLLAVGLNRDEPRRLPLAVACGAAIAAVLLAIACYLSGYRPVLSCQGHLRAAQWAAQPTALMGNAAECRRELEAAAAADPLAAEPQRQLAALALAEWEQQPNDERYARFEQASAAALRLAPHSAPAWLASADQHLLAFAKSDGSGKPLRPAAGQRAVEDYRRAVELYPTSGKYRARLAVAGEAVGDHAAARREAATALELDDATPYPDKKLSPSLREQLTALAEGKALR